MSGLNRAQSAQAHQAQAEVTFIGRVGCHLCDVAHEVVLDVQSEEPFDLVELDADSDPELRAEYGDQVPVVLVNGEMHSFFDVDRVRLLAAVADAKNPGSSVSPT